MPRRRIIKKLEENLSTSDVKMKKEKQKKKKKKKKS